jgi:hypothetical protein
MHDGTPPHFTIAVREHLHNTYPERWVGCIGTITWPPHSPDLNPLDFFLWVHLLLQSAMWWTCSSELQMDARSFRILQGCLSECSSCYCNVLSAVWK